MKKLVTATTLTAGIGTALVGQAHHADAAENYTNYNNYNYNTTQTTTTTTTSKPDVPGTTTEEKPKLPQTGESVETGLVFAGIVILSSTVVLKRRYSNK